MLVSVAASALVAWGAILDAPSALFWDDWVIANDDKLRMTSELGIPWVGYVMTVLFALGPWSFKVLVIASTIVTGWLVYGISGRGLGLAAWERWALSALVVALPLFDTRLLASVSTYSWSIALFALAWYLLVRTPPNQPGRARYIVATVLLLVSYTTGSLLPLTAFPLAHLGLLTLRGRWTVRTTVKFAGRFWFIIATPLAFWVVRSLFLQPYGIYEGYNSLNASLSWPMTKVLLTLVIAIGAAVVVLFYRGLARVPRFARTREALSSATLGVVAVVLGVTLDMMRNSDNPLTATVPLLLVASGIVVLMRAIVLAVREPDVPDDAPALERDTSPLLAVGIALFAFAVLPYLLVGKVPTFENWEARHQVLMPIGVAAIVVAGLRAAAAFVGVRPAAVIGALIVAGGAAVSLISTLGLVADAHKVEQVISALEDEQLVRAASTVYFVDDARALNWEARPYSFYEYTGWMQSAYGDQARLGIDQTSLAGFLDGEMTLLPDYGARYGISEYVRSTDGVEVRIRPTGTWWDLLLGRPAIALDVTAVADLESLR